MKPMMVADDDYSPEERIAGFLSNLWDALETEGFDDVLKVKLAVAAVNPVTDYYLKGQ